MSSSSDRMRRSDRPTREGRTAAVKGPDRTRREYQTVPVGRTPPKQTTVRQQVSHQMQQQQSISGGHFATAEEMRLLQSLRDGYKRAALGYKLNGFTDPALKMFRTAKQLDIMIEAINTNRPIDLKGLPPPAPLVPISRKSLPQRTSTTSSQGMTGPSKNSLSHVIPSVEIDTVQSEKTSREELDAAPTRRRHNPEDFVRKTSLSSGHSSSFNVSNVSSEMSPSHASSKQTLLSPEDSRSPSPSLSMVSDAISGTLSSAVSREDIARIFNAPVQALSVEEALQQRMEKYQETFEKAEAEGNSSKARRLGRIVKQYENAMKAHKSGSDFDFDSLPTPPGFPPIPMGDHSIKQILNSEPRRVKARAPDPPAAAVSHQKPATSVTNYRPKTELNDRVDDLLSKQRQLKEAAVRSHNEGDKTSALKYLRLAKGFDPVIEAVKSGLPVDESSIPQLPMELLISNVNLD